ncbi:hypothetical protein LEP1GSC188_3024 [Leptospira weilii serovar Topaz str. LT2116]|uniref:Uncharacterized protein n=1 Tax=Leptospira weilii serovar Topaz str. LT2116 TaxID=1088540 RepID=M3GA88_9LEPT|nr:hypothetical protein LEP1GSC188_3024 [Leptospira weilii serovar Topaz str. LT2116]
MEPNPESNRRSNMQRAIANEMTRSELSQFLSDPKSKKEFFELMKLKIQIGYLSANRKNFDVFHSQEKKEAFSILEIRFWSPPVFYYFRPWRFILDFLLRTKTNSKL